MLLSFEEYFNISGFITVTCFLVALVYLASYVKKSRKLPPGPVGLPVIGYLPFLTKTPHEEFEKLASKYGTIFSMRLGSNLFIVINKGDDIREAFSKPEFLGRPPENPFSVVKDFESPFFSNGKVWQEQRRFAVQTMKDLGLGKSRMEKHIVEEIQYFLGGITKSNGSPISIIEKLRPSVSNNISSLVFGSRYKYDDPQRILVDNALEAVFASQQITLTVLFPWLKMLPYSRKIFTKELIKQAEYVMTVVRERIQEHEKTLDPEDIRDYIDGYLTEMKTRLQKDPQTVFSYKMLTGSVFGLFGAGSDTIRSTVDWSMYTMAVFQDVQKNVQAEIDETIGKEKMPSWQDQKEMPFTQAVLAEIQRWKTVAPLGVLRYTLEDTELRGYHIPKGTSVISNLWYAHHDPEEWERPDEFVPNRFLSEDGKSFVKHPCYMPFATGKRSCPGEIFASIQTFLYFTSILQKFSVEIPEGTSADFEGNSGFTYTAKPHLLRFRSRS